MVCVETNAPHSGARVFGLSFLKVLPLEGLSRAQWPGTNIVRREDRESLRLRRLVDHHDGLLCSPGVISGGTRRMAIPCPPTVSIVLIDGHLNSVSHDQSSSDSSSSSVVAIGKSICLAGSGTCSVKASLRSFSRASNSLKFPAKLLSHRWLTLKPSWFQNSEFLTVDGGGSG
jgi:hypothetical protein